MIKIPEISHCYLTTTNQKKVHQLKLLPPKLPLKIFPQKPLESVGLLNTSYPSSLPGTRQMHAVFSLTTTRC